MRLLHSFSLTLAVSAFASLSSLSGCSSDPEPASGGGGTGPGTGGTGVTGGTGTTGGSSGAGPTGGSSGAGTTGGSGGAGTTGGSGGSGGGGANDHPTDSSQAGIEAFLAAMSYTTTGMGWKPETAPSAGMMVPHMANKRYFNQTLITSYAAGQRTSMQASGSMVVKDILTGTTVIGQAAMLKIDTSWVFYCKASEDNRCFTGSTANTAVYGTAGGTTGCTCHTTGIIISGSVIPPS